MPDIEAVKPSRKVRRLLRLYQPLQLSLILDEVASLPWFLDMEVIVHATCRKWKIFALPIHSYIEVKEDEQYDYDLAQCWGPLLKKKYLAVDQLNKAVSVVYVIRLAGSNATQLVTHT